MAGRPVDHQRRAQLLDAAVDYAVERGFAELSWRPIAASLGVSTTTLVHHFGTKERLLESILGRLRERIVVVAGELAGERPDLATAARAVWTWSSDTRQWATFKLFFAVYGNALQAPELFSEFLEHVGTDWMAALCEVQAPDTDPDTAIRNATLVIATIRGLLLDLLGGGDPARVQDAADHFIAGLS